MGVGFWSGFSAFMTLALVLLMANAIAQERQARKALQDADIQGPDDPALEQHLKRLLTSGRKIEALRVYRSASGASLRRAKEVVDAMAKEIGA